MAVSSRMQDPESSSLPAACLQVSQHKVAHSSEQRLVSVRKGYSLSLLCCCGKSPQLRQLREGRVHLGCGSSGESVVVEQRQQTKGTVLEQQREPTRSCVRLSSQSDTRPHARLHLLSLPKQRHQPGPECSVPKSVGSISFEPPQELTWTLFLRQVLITLPRLALNSLPNLREAFLELVPLPQSPK